MQNAFLTDKLVNGFKSLSPLVGIPNFDVIHGCVIDYMHNVCLGVCRQMLDLYFDSENHAQDFYIGRKKDFVNQRLGQIKPPSFVSKMPSSLDHRKIWKANELRCWILYYAIPCLSGVLPQIYLNHLSLLSHSVYLLLQTSITENDLKDASSYLQIFIEQYERYDTHNIIFKCNIYVM